MAFKVELFVLFMVVVCTTTVSGFFLSWGSPQPVKIQPPPSSPQVQPQLPQQSQQYPTLAYYQRVMQNQQPQYIDSNGVPIQPLQPIPAIPIQVPLQAQFAPAPTVQNVQLVPCLCPVSQDMENMYVDNIAYQTSQANPTSSTPQHQQSQMQQLPQGQQQVQQQ